MAKKQPRPRPFPACRTGSKQKLRAPARHGEYPIPAPFVHRRFLLENNKPEEDIPLVNLKIVIELGEDGYYVAHCPALKSCWSQGKTRDEALKNVREAIDFYLEPAPSELTSTKEREVVDLTI
jgi:predicted RNase H-like HicB family nuclease